MFKIIFSLDYEIHGNGDGSPYEMMVEPTKRLIELLNKYDAKLTILADVAEILKFKEYYEQFNKDDYFYSDILDQLKNAVTNGHDVQLHLHSSYLNSVYENKRWKQDWSEYNLAALEYDRIDEIIKLGKNFLETLLIPIKPAYECYVFRAAGWSMSPSKNIINTLINNGIKIDTSVWKYGVYETKVINFDYTNAFSEIIPWFLNEKDVCKKDNKGKLLEVPIYCDKKKIWSFITPIRIFRIIRALRHKHRVSEDGYQITSYKKKKSKLKKISELFFREHPWKLDMNQATGRQLINALKRIEKKYIDIDYDIPIVLSGHSKNFIKLNKYTLEPFLKYIVNHEDKYQFALYSDIDIELYRR